MDRSYETDVGGATYRSKDPIKNFRLSINLQRVSPAALGVLTSRLAASEGAVDTPTVASLSATSVNEFGQTILENENLSIQWQQKYFSAREFEVYSVAPSDGDVKEYRYYNDVQKLKKSGGRRNVRIYTCLENDPLAPAGDELDPMTTSPDEVPTLLATKVMELRRRKPLPSSANALSTKLKKGQGARGLKIVVKDPSEEFRQNNHILNTPVHRMIVMADLSPEGQLGNNAYEKRLCEIVYDENGVLQITPDFTRGNLPYRVDSGLGRDIWLYTVTSASTTMTRMEKQKDTRLLKQLYGKHQAYLTSLVGKEFEEVNAGVLRLAIHGEIISAQSFEYDDLHIEYFLDLPRNWTSSPDVLLSGCTHSCRTHLSNNIEVAHYSHPFSYDIYLSYSKEDIEEATIEWPKLYLQVVSVDFWGRCRAEGYGFVALPSTAGTHKIKVDCWRPIGNAGQESVLFELRRFFIGASPELEDTSYAGVPNTFEDSNVLCKYGVRTESTGSVMVHMNCIIQQEATKTDKVTAHVQRRKQQTALQLAKGKAANEAIQGVMDAFLRARKRMQEARESVPEHIRRNVEGRVNDPQSGDGQRSEHLNRVLAGETIWRENDDEETTA